MSDNIVFACVILLLMACASNPVKERNMSESAYGFAGGWARTEFICPRGTVVIGQRCIAR